MRSIFSSVLKYVVYVATCFFGILPSYEYMKILPSEKIRIRYISVSDMQNGIILLSDESSEPHFTSPSRSLNPPVDDGYTFSITDADMPYISELTILLISGDITPEEKLL